MIRPEHNTGFDDSERVNRILEVIMAYARLDFTQKTEVLGSNDVVDAIGAGVNMLGEELQASTISLREKEFLLKEIHHRVKNNLQIVSSLLSLQLGKIGSPEYQEMVNDSRNRINSMSLVHEMLYASKDLSRIEIGEYIRRLSDSIKRSFERPNSTITFHYDIQSGLFFDVDKMISLGLILNEIICNSMKYAFPRSYGSIRVSLHTDEEQGYRLFACDDGVGLPSNFNPETDANLGIQLIQILVEQIEGHLEIKKDTGTAFLIFFK
jgi:two-component sensor histidine kinase